MNLPPGQYFYLAFCYPFSYTSSIRLLDLVQQKVQNYNDNSVDDKIHYENQLLCKSYEGRDINLMTITEKNEITGEDSNVDTKYYQDPELIIPNAFSDKFIEKKCLIVTCRVHPGETPGQLNFSGFLKFVLSADPRAIILRSHFVIHMVPILNPDGVYRGHFRMDYFGNNLNRFYMEPDPKFQPQCYALKTFISWMVKSRNEDKCNF